MATKGTEPDFDFDVDWDEKKTLGEWERELGEVIDGDVDEKLILTRKDFVKLCHKNGSIGVDHEAREEYLAANGHEVNRKNLTNREL
jgi:hypothetical protein